MPTVAVACIALAGTDVAAVVWRQGDALGVTVVVKATFALRPDGPMKLAEPQPLRRRDHHHDDSPARSVRAPAELAPQRPQADVTFAGHAVAPGGKPVAALGVRLALYRGKLALLDKTLHVHGERSRDSAGKIGSAARFAKVPLQYERTLRGDANPSGVAPGGKPPQIVEDTGLVEVTAGLGPVSPYAKSRRALLGGGSRKALEQPIADVPADFDWRYFHAAPEDQRVPFLQGDEWLVLDHLCARRSRLASQLPHARAAARVSAKNPTAAQAAGLNQHDSWCPVALSADGLHVDGDTEIATVTWRGSFRVASEEALGDLRIAGGLSLAGAPIEWPAPATVAPSEPAATQERPAASGFDSARTLTGGGPRGPATPFETGRPKPVWGELAIKPVPQLIGEGVVTYVGPSNATITLSPEQRQQALAQATAPYPVAAPGTSKPTAPAGAPYSDQSASEVSPPAGDVTIGLDRFAGTRDLSSSEQAAAATRTLAPFSLAQPGRGGPGSALPGTPWSKPVEPDEAALPRDGEAEPVEASRLFHELPRPEQADEPPAPEAAPAVPERTTEAIPLYGNTPLTLVAVPWQHRPPRDSLTVLVKASCEIVRDSPARLCEETAAPTGELHVDDDPARSVRYPSDFAQFKPRADVVLVGSAYPPRHDGVRRGAAAQARFGFGNDRQQFDRAVAVLGDRQWHKALLALAPSDPAPFERMPLTYERAFGAPGYDDNPVGVGYGAHEADDGVARLPNLEQPDGLIDSPADRPEPACFAPVPSSWPSRTSKLGSYGARWLQERWPYFPDDFDWSYFQCAPPDQQLDYLAGDEPFSLVAMHPEHPRIDGTLPGVRPRCFMCIEGADSGASGVELAFEEVLLRLDTAVFDADAMTIQLVWRGIVEVKDEHAPEIRAMVLTTEPLGQEKSNEEIYDELLALAAPLEPMAESPDGSDEPQNDVAPASAEADDQAAALELEIQEQQAKLHEQLARAGFEVPAATAAPPQPPPPSPEQLAASLRKLGASDSAVAELLAALTATDDGVDADRLAPSAREQVMAALAAGSPLDEADLAGADLSGLDLSGQSLRAANLKDADLTDAVLRGADLSGATLMGASLERAQLQQCCLRSADLAEAKLDGAVLDGAELSEADASEAHGHGASFRAATGERLRLNGGSLAGARFDQATLPELRLSESTIDGAVFDGADLTGARLLDARGQQVSLRSVHLDGAACDGASLPGADLRKAQARGSVWEDAELDDAHFLEAELTEASFVRASLKGADFSGAVLREARMKRVCAPGAKFVMADLKAAQLERSVLSRADFTGANLYGAELWKADTAEAIFTDALVGMSKLEDES